MIKRYTVRLDPDAKTIRPADAEGDAYYGLGPGTNGTAAMTRRAGVAQPGFTWVRANGSHATGIQYVATGEEFVEDNT